MSETEISNPTHLHEVDVTVRENLGLGNLAVLPDLTECQHNNELTATSRTARDTNISTCTPLARQAATTEHFWDEECRSYHVVFPDGRNRSNNVSEQ